MTIRNQIEEDIRDAMRSRAQARLEALRFLKSVALNVEKHSPKITKIEIRVVNVEQSCNG